MKQNLTLSFLLISYFFASCTAERFNYREKNHTAEDVSVHNLSTKPMMADLEISSHKSEARFTYDFADKMIDVNFVKNEAVMNLLEQEQADIIVEPVYSVTTEKRIVTVKVSGYAARYKNFIAADKMDTMQLKKIKMMASSNLPNYNYISASQASASNFKDSQILNQKKKSGVGAVLATIGLTLGIILLSAGIAAAASGR